MALNSNQKEQVEKQIAANEHNMHRRNMKISSGLTLGDFYVYKNVLNPQSVVALHFARWLHNNPSSYLGKSAIDMGCGTGLQGIVMALSGAKHVTCSDISSSAVENTSMNVSQYGLEEKVNVVQGDLFGNIKESAEVVVFNHPFFAANPNSGTPITLAMLDDGGLIHRFFKESKRHLNPGGKILMPYFEMAGDTNNPLVQAKKHGLSAEVVHNLTLETGCQQGEMSIYQLMRYV